MLLLLSFAFLAGLATILAPCIWPVLPIVLSSSIAGRSGHQRPLGVTLGVIISFTFFTLSISTLVSILHFNPNVLRIFAVSIIALLGITMMIPPLSGTFELAVSKLTNAFGQNANQQGNGFLAGFITGLSLGIVWSPCAGPILATIATLAATGRVTIDVILVTIAYVIGIGIPLFIFAYGGQYFILRTRILSRYTGLLQQLFGVIMIFAAIAIYTNYDQTLQLQLLNKFPQLGTAINSFENSNAVTNQLNMLRGKPSAVTTIPIDTSKLFNTNSSAPDFFGITKWLNTDKALSINDLRGKVVLVDFWTYTCINCIRTLPYVTSWYDKYHNKGFVVIGVHTPEFQFEKETNNVLNAINKYNIHYPVAQDNDYTTWNKYNNQYWPAEYLIDAKGHIRLAHFGEGEYDKTEQAIQSLLKENGQQITEGLNTTQEQTPTENISPETYLGSKRMQYYYPNGNTGNGQQDFTLSDLLPHNSFSYGGNWTIQDENAIAGNNATINYNFTAAKVFIILRQGFATRGKVTVYLDDKVIDATNAGQDVQNGSITVDIDKLYNIIDLHGKTETHTVKLEFQTPGVEAFTFTFG